MKIIFRYILILFFCSVFFISCDGKKKTAHILFDFESETELDQLNWRCHVLYSLSDHYAAHGKKSLKMELFPASYPGVSPELRDKDKDWSDYDVFSFNVFNPSDETVDLILRIDDKEEALKYDERYNKTFKIVPGNNKCILALDDLKTSISQRPMNPEHIHRLMVFMSHPDRPHILYLDYFSLTKGGSVER